MVYFYFFALITSATSPTHKNRTKCVSLPSLIKTKGIFSSLWDLTPPSQSLRPSGNCWQGTDAYFGVVFGHRKFQCMQEDYVVIRIDRLCFHLSFRNKLPPSLFDWYVFHFYSLDLFVLSRSALISTNLPGILWKEAVCSTYFYSPGREAFTIQAPSCHNETIVLYKWLNSAPPLWGSYKPLPSSLPTSLETIDLPQWLLHLRKAVLFSYTTIAFTNVNNPRW